MWSLYTPVLYWLALLIYLCAVRINWTIDKRMEASRKLWYLEERRNIADFMLVTADAAKVLGNLRIEAEMRRGAAEILSKPN